MNDNSRATGSGQTNTPSLLLCFFSALGTLIAFGGCGTLIRNSTFSSVSASATSNTPIQHVVVIVQENRTFDNLFHDFPGADSAQSGMNKGTFVSLSPIPLAESIDLDHSHRAWWRAWSKGSMDGFADPTLSLPLYAYSYVQQADVREYWTMASKYTLADRMFQSNSGPSFPAYQYIIAAQSGKASGNPSSPNWGCDAQPGSTVPLIGPNGTDLPGVFPCFDYRTLADLLDAKAISWRYYTPSDVKTGSIFSAYEAIRHIFYSPEWYANVISPQSKVLTDIGNGQLAHVTWVTPDWAHSDHPGNNSNEGPDWVTSIVNAIGASKFWNSTAIFILWDDWGGWYDHVAPSPVDNMGPGFRVPLIVVSPYAKHGYVSHQVFETASLATFIERNFGLPNLGGRDATANDLSDCFDFTQTVKPFARIRTAVSAETILREAPSGLPDND